MTGGPYVQPLVLIEISQSYVWLHRQMLRRGRAERVFKNSLGLGKRLFHVAGAQFEMVADVRLPPFLNMRQVGKGFGRFVLLMDERRFGLHRIENIVNGRQRLVLNFDELKSVFGRAFVCCRDRHNRVSGITSLLYGEYRLIAKRRAEVWIDSGHPRDFCAGQHRRDAGQFLRLCFNDFGYTRVRVGAAQHRDVEHSGHFDIADMERPSGDFWIRIGSADRLPDN